MMPEERIPAAARRLREAVSAGLHAEVLGRVADYCRAVEQALSGMAPGDARAGSIGRDALELLAWARATTLATRAGYVAALGALPELGRYAAHPAGHSWEIEG